MLNYIWAGLIIFSLVFALANDISDFRSDKYRNSASLPIVIESPVATEAPSTDVKVRIDPAVYRDFYRTDEKPAESYAATLVKTPKGHELRFPASAALPPRLAKIRDMTS